MNSDKAYHDHEMKRAFAHYKAIQTGSRYEQEENYKVFVTESAELIAEKVGWILDGSYGYGEQQIALNALEQRNPNPSLYHLIASLEWNIGEYYSRKAWKNTPVDKQKAINEAITAEIQYYKDGMGGLFQM